MTWRPRIIIFQCQFCLPSELDQYWMDHKLPKNMHKVHVPCTGRINSLYILNAIQGGADGILVSGCMPEKCHYKEGSLGARRTLEEFRNFLAYLGVEDKRIGFVWMNLDEQGSIQKEITAFEQIIFALGPHHALATRTLSATEKST